MTKSIQVEDDLLTDLKLVKRVLGKKNMTEVIRYLMNARGYDEVWVDYMSNVLSEGSNN